MRPQFPPQDATPWAGQGRATAGKAKHRPRRQEAARGEGQAGGHLSGGSVAKAGSVVGAQGQWGGDKIFWMPVAP